MVLVFLPLEALTVSLGWEEERAMHQLQESRKRGDESCHGGQVGR